MAGSYRIRYFAERHYHNREIMMYPLKAACPPKYPTLKSLGAISSLLNHSLGKGNQLEEALGIACEAIGAGAAAIYRRAYPDPQHFYLECEGKWEGRARGHSSFPEHISAEALPPCVWQQLNGPTLSSLTAADLKASLPECDLLVLPLFFDGNPFGLIVFCDVAAEGLNQPVQDYIHTLGNIFELWICKINVKKRFEDLFNFIPNPSFIMALDEKIVAWNRSNEEMTGWKAGQIIGKGNYESSLPYYFERRPMVANLIMKPDSKWEQTYYEFVKEGDKIDSLAFCPALPGGGAYLRTKTLRLYDVNHRLWGAIHAVRDVTLERQMRENLQRSESMYRAISDFAGVGILLFKDREIVYFNEQILGFMQKQGQTLTREDFLDWVHPDDRQMLVDLAMMPHDDRQGPFRFEFRAKEGLAMRYYSAHAQLIAYQNQETIHFIIDDITEKKERDRKARLNELKLYHEGRLTSLGIMAAGIAHELNQPLNTIRVVTDGFLYGKEKGWGMDLDELYENLEMISRQVIRMSDVIQNIRNFAREDREQMLSDINVNEAIQNVCAMIGRQLEAHSIVARKDLSPDLPLIKANLNRLEQVIMNLVGNARQALDACRHRRKELWIKTDSPNGHVRIEVGDNATGIPENVMEKIFDPFFTTKEVGQGTGLGLTISLSIVSEFNGELKAFNNEKGGATFVVSVPALRGPL